MSTTPEKLDGTEAVTAVDRPKRTTRGVPPGAVRIETVDHARWIVRAGCRGESLNCSYLDATSKT